MAVLLSSFSPSRASRAIATGAATTSFTPQDPQSWATGASTTSFAATCAATASSSPQDPRLRIYRSRSPSQALRCPISVTISFAGPSQGEERQGTTGSPPQDRHHSLSPTASTFPSLESLPPGQIHNISVLRSTTPFSRSATTGGEGHRGVGASHSEKNKEEPDYETEEDDHYSEEDDHYSEEDDHYSEDDDYFSADDDGWNTWTILRGPGLSGDESFDKCCIFGNEVQLTCNQRNQLCSIVEELPMPEMKHYVCTLMNSNVIPGEGKMLPTEDDSEDEIADEDAEGMEYEEEAGDGIFQVTVADPDGNQKPFHLMNGPIYVPEEIRGTLYKTVFTDMHAVGEADMTEIVWEMYKDASNDVDSIDELQYIVHKVDAVDAKSKRLALPENLVHGYNYPRELQGFLPGS
ncbi:hypothetical protein ACQ4PT_066627 [Festuca glaucescens]